MKTFLITEYTSDITTLCANRDGVAGGYKGNVEYCVTKKLINLTIHQIRVEPR
jgi:hypothetical protein